MNILFTCAGRRNYLIHYFKEIIGESGNTIAVDSDATAPAFAAADISITIPSLFASGYIDTLISVIKENQVDLIIPLNDLELPIMAANKEKLEAYGAKVIISHPDLIDLCADKWRTYNFLEDLKIPTPKTFIGIDDALMALEEKSIDFPMIIKPRWGFGSVGIEEVATDEELRLTYKLLSVKVNNTLMASTRSETLRNQIILQEKICGEEYGVDILNDFDGNYHGSYVRKKLAMRAGETDKAMTVIADRYTKVAEKIAKATRHIGNMDCDFFLKGDEICFLEMNPRFGGGYPFTHEAGVKIPGIYLEWAKGNSEISKYDNYSPDCIFSKYDTIVKVKKIEQLVKKKIQITT